MENAPRFIAFLMVGLWLAVVACSLTGGMDHMAADMHHGKAHMMECCVIGSAGVEVTPFINPSPFFAAVSLTIVFLFVIPSSRMVRIYHPPRV